MIKHNHLSVPFLLTLVTGYSCHQPEASKSKPNIILIMTDDQGFGDIGFNGNPDIKTPFLDSLAKASTRMTNFHVSPVCAPTRASLMTGRYALRTGVYDTYNGGAIMATEEVTIAEMLKAEGYRTGVFGKWHLGDNYPFRPMEQGFDESLIHQAGGIGQPGDHFENFMRPDSSYFDPILSKNGENIKTKGYCSDVFSQHAVDFIKENQKDPFFLYLAYNAPHTPLQVPQKYLDLYADLEIDAEHYPYPLPEMNSRDYEDAKRVYAMVTNIDDNLRNVYKQLEKSTLLENTLIIFMTDNGPQQRRYTGGLRALKGSTYEGGVRVPCFWYWKGKIAGNHEIPEVMAHIDVLPTLMEMIGVNVPAGQNIDGISFWPLIQGEETENWKDRSLFLEWERGFNEPYKNMAVIKDEYKLVANRPYYDDTSLLELYNLETDPFERDTISLGNPEKYNELKVLLENYYDELIHSKNLEPQRIMLGSENENPVVLNRNDWRGPKQLPWLSSNAYGYWDVSVVTPGKYEVELGFGEVKLEGRAWIRIGRVQRSITDWDSTTNIITFPPFEIPEGDFMVDAWLHRSWTEIQSPIYVKFTLVK